MIITVTIFNLTTIFKEQNVHGDIFDTDSFLDRKMISCNLTLFESFHIINYNLCDWLYSKFLGVVLYL